jgi:hypothetical protein
LQNVLVGSILTIIAVNIGGCSGFFASILLYFYSSYYILGGLMGLLIGFGVALIWLDVFDSGMIVMLMCVCESPELLHATLPDLYNLLHNSPFTKNALSATHASLTLVSL